MRLPNPRVNPTWPPLHFGQPLTACVGRQQIQAPTKSRMAYKVEIREATTGNDFELARTAIYALVDWLRQLYPEARNEIDQDFQTVGSEVDAYKAQPDTLLLAHSVGDIVGIVALREIDHRICEMKHLFVYEKFRNQGVGRTLATFLIQHARALGYARMRLCTGNRQITALALYQKLGFQEISCYYATSVAPSPTLRFMELHLLANASTGDC